MTIPGYPKPPVSSAIDVVYAENPWARLEANQVQWYDPYVSELYRTQALFPPFVRHLVSFQGVGSKEITVTQILDPHPNYDSLGLREIWTRASHIDSRSQTITFSRYGGKVAYSRYDPIVNWWQAGGASKIESVKVLLNSALGKHMIDVLDMLARNAMLQMPFRRYANDKLSAATITSTDKITTEMLTQFLLGMRVRNVWGWDGNGQFTGEIVCITTPGVIHDLQNEPGNNGWVYRQAYSSPNRALLNYEVGTYMGIRFVSSPHLILWNCGSITVQAEVTAPINPGDGTPDSLVDQVYSVGQPGRVRKFIQLAATTNMSLFKVGDIVTIHKRRSTAAFGVTDGVDFLDGTLHNRRVVGIDAANKRLELDTPVLEAFDTPVSTGVYAYVTKGHHLHASIFVGGPEAVVLAVAQPPRLYAPQPIDDFEHIQRFSWDAYLGYAPYNPFHAEVLITSGSVRHSGPMLQG